MLLIQRRYDYRKKRTICIFHYHNSPIISFYSSLPSLQCIMMCMKISVVIPVYNEEEHIGACLQSLKKQTTPPDEIIIVNNNSTDASVAIAQKYGVKIVNEKQQGMIYARNRGFDEAQGDIIARTDSDALLPPNWIEKIKSHFQNHTVDAVGGPIIYYDLPFNTRLPAKIFLSLLKRIQKGEPALLGPNM